MLKLTLRLRRTERPQRAAAAWFLAGDDPRAWLDELARWNLPLGPLALYVVPRSAADRRPCGLFVVPGEGTAPRTVVRAEPYGCLGRRLYLPLAARLGLSATEAEIDALVVGDVAVFHPAAGLVSFEAADVLRVWDMLAPPLRRAVAWDRARPGVAMPPRLLAVTPATTPSVDEALYQWQDDIGTQPPDELPRAPGEPARWSFTTLGVRIAAVIAGLRPGPRLRRPAPATSSAMNSKMRGRRILRRPLAWLACIGALALFVFAPSPAEQPLAAVIAAVVIVLAVLAWAYRGRAAGAGAAGQAATRAAGILAARQREINRLLHLLDADPDEGLRFALPIRGGHRGLAAPGGQLAPRDVNFDLRRVGVAGGPADPWIVPWEVQQELRERYRRLADRELRLGRHRRAAYILAELLGDVSAAADVLVEGGRCRDAAVLYRDRLNRPLDAAAAFERCGAWDEAIDLYVTHERYETAGDVLARIERPEDAAEMYRRQVARLAAAGDRLAAAALAERKLRDPAAAVSLLAAAWPDTLQARPCLKELFHLLGRLGRHDDAAAWVARLREQPLSHHLVAACDVLADVGAAYPHRPVRSAAADATRVLAGRRLEYAGDVESKELVAYVRALAPQDALLGRDAARFLSRASSSSASAAGPPGRKRGARGKPGSAGVVRHHRFRLPSDVSWQAAVGMGRVFFAAGFHRRGVTLVRGFWEGTVERIDWSVPSAERHRLLLESCSTNSVPLALVLDGGPPLKIEQFSTLGEWPWPVRCGTPRWVTSEVRAVGYSEDGTAWTFDGQQLVSARRPDGAPLASHDLPVVNSAIHDSALDAAGESPPLIVARRHRVHVAVGRM